MTTTTVTALFRSRSEAERAIADLQSELALAGPNVRLHAADGSATETISRTEPAAGGQPGSSRGGGGVLASLRDLFMPAQDRDAYAEGIRRGNVMISALVEPAQLEQALDVLDRDGALDLDQQESEWRGEGWSEPSHPSLAAAPATAATASGEQVIPLVEEQLSIGKREVERGRVRVRSYVVETPVEQQVSLREEHVQIDRRPVARSGPVDDPRAFQERALEVHETAEEAVTSKTARVREEVVVRKDARTRVETVHDTVRRTEVEVENGRPAGAAAPANPAASPANKPAG